MRLKGVLAGLILVVPLQVEGSKLQRAWDRARSMHVVTQASGVDGNGQPSRLHVEIRISDEGSLFIEFAHGDQESWRLDANRTRLFLRKGIVTEEVPYRRVAVEYPITQLKAGRVELHPVWAILGWWPEGFPLKCPLVHNAPTHLLASIREAGGQVRIKETEDTIVVRIPREEIELSRSHGLAITRRTWLASDTGRPLSTMVVNEFFRVTPDIWCPRSFQVWRHNPNDATEVRTVTIEVIEATIDDLTPSDFAFDPSPGTYLLDADGGGGGRQIVPGGFDMMQLFVRRLRSTSTGGSWQGVTLLLGVLAGIAVYSIVIQRAHRTLQ